MPPPRTKLTRNALVDVLLIVFALACANPASAITPVMTSSLSTCLAFEDAQPKLTPDAERSLHALVDAVDRTTGDVSALVVHVYFGRQQVGARLDQAEFPAAFALALERSALVSRMLITRAAAPSRLLAGNFSTSTSSGPLYTPSTCSSSVRVQFRSGASMECGGPTCRVQCTADACRTTPG